jgi:2-oxoglutarate dehydrogenase E2 component (dihydrolipoamide succinyltransferase)
MTTAVEIRAPAEQTEGTRSQILRWLKNVGDSVAENEPLIEIETDKVTVEVASPGSGILREIVKEEQEEIIPGELLGRIESSRTAAAVSDDLQANALRGNGASGGDGSRPQSASDAAGPASDATGFGGSGAAASDVTARPDAASQSAPNLESASSPADASAATRLSPAVRRLLSENSLDPAAVRGTGQGGRLSVEDVMSAISAKASGHSGGVAVATPAAQARPVAAGMSPGNPAPATSAAVSNSEVTGNSRRIPHSAVRKRIAEHMVQSLLHTAPHVTTVFEVDMTAVLAHRLQHRDDFARRGVPLTLTAYFLQAAVDALRAVPEANSRWTDTALEVFESMHIGVATALEEGGLVVPVLRDVQSRDLFATAHGLHDLVVRAREGRLAPADVRGGTFTISNHGVSGSLVATPIIINQPQSAILGIGKLEKRPVVVTEGGEDRIVIRPRCHVTLTIDHRVMDGHQANRFLQTFVERLTRWPG